MGDGQGGADPRIPGMTASPGYGAPMSLSIRNQLPGTVTAVTPGEAMATVRVRLTGGQDLTAAITREAADDLGLSAGSAVRALVKSTEVSLATGRTDGLSIRNRLPGAVTRHDGCGGARRVRHGRDCTHVLNACLERLCKTLA